MNKTNFMKPSQLIASGLLMALAGGLQAQTAATAPAAAPAVGSQSAEGEGAKPTVEPRIMRGTDQLVAPPTPYTPIDGPGSSYKFEDAPILDVIHVFMREVIKTNYILHQPITGSVTLATRGPIKPDDALALLESALQVNGLAMGQDSRGVFHIGRADALKGVTSNIRMSGGKGPMAPGMGAVLIPLQFIGAGEMASILKPMVPGDAIVRVDSVRNMLVMMGTRTQAEAWLQMVNTFDVSLLKGMSVGVFPLKYATVQEVESALQLLNTGASGGGGGAPAAPAAPRSNSPAPGAGGAGGAAAAAASAAPVALSENFPLYGAIRVLPIARINSILVVTPRAAYLDEARQWIEKLDQPSDNGAEAQLFIYQVQNVNARHLATVLSGIFGGMNPFGTGTGPTGATGVAPGLGGATGNMGGMNNNAFGGGNAFGNQTVNNANRFGGNTGNMFGQSAGAGFGSGGLSNLNQRNQANTTPPSISVTASFGNIRVAADELNNSVLVWATRGEYQKLESTLKRLDIPPTQVMIEATIVEVTLGDDLNYGLQWAFSDPTPLGRQGRFSGSGVIGGNPNTQTDGAANWLESVGKGFTYALTNSSGNVRALLTALSAKTKLKVVSSPSLMVLDNHTATISVGEQQPVKTGETYIGTGNTTVSNSIQFKDTGVNLVVTPSVNAGNLVTMQVDQMLTDLGTYNEALQQYAFMQRQISSKVAVRSGDAIVLGGLIKDSDKKSTAGVPILSSIPYIGGLFGNQGSNYGRTELLVVISPRVVRTDVDIRDVSDDLRDRMKGLKGFEGLGNSNRQPVQSAPPLAPLAPQ